MDLKKQKELLIAKRAEVQERINKISRDKMHSDKELDSDFEEQAVQRENDEVLDALDDQGIEEIHQIDQALKRLDEGKYGICIQCSSSISEERLEALPFTVKCMKCAG